MTVCNFFRLAYSMKKMMRDKALVNKKYVYAYIYIKKDTTGGRI